MMRLLAARLLNYRSFHKFTLLHVSLIVLLCYVASRFTLNIQGSIDVLRNLFALPGVWRTVTGLSRWLFYIPAFFVIQLVCAEFELKLVRAQIIAGLERWQMVASWVAQNLLLTVVAVITTVACGALLGYNSVEQTDSSLTVLLVQLLRAELGYAIYGMAFLNVAVLCAVLLRRPVPAIVLLVLWPMLGEPALSYGLEHYGWAAAQSYLPFASLGTLVTWHETTAPFDPFAMTTLVAVVYAALAAGVAWLVLERADL
jgi:hypothetical protein